MYEITPDRIVKKNIVRLLTVNSGRLRVIYCVFILPLVFKSRIFIVLYANIRGNNHFLLSFFLYFFTYLTRKTITIDPVQHSIIININKSVVCVTFSRTISRIPITIFLQVSAYGVASVLFSDKIYFLLLFGVAIHFFIFLEKL